MSPTPLSMLLVDDDANFRRALAVALRLEGHQVTEACSLDEASQALSTGAFSAVLVDLLLSLSEGVAVGEGPWRRLTDRLTIVCSPHPEALSAARTRLPTALQLQKPFSPSALTRLVLEHRSH